jgi:serine/threonine-protein kinase
MSPEQLYGEADIDARADVWAAGAVLFECLTGERPVAGRTMPQVLRTLATRDVPKTDALAPGLPAGLGAMIDRMLTRDRSARLSSVEPVIALADELLAHDDA